MKQIRCQWNSPLFAAVSLFAVVLACPLRADPPRSKASMQQRLTRSLRASAGTASSDWRKLLAAHVQAEELKDVPGRWQRSPQGVVGDVQRVIVTPTQDKAAPYHGVIVLSVEWKTPLQLYFKSKEEALAAELTESDPRAAVPAVRVPERCMALSAGNGEAAEAGGLETAPAVGSTEPARCVITAWREIL